jgi:alpha-1,6-mannosyltransferase
MTYILQRRLELSAVSLLTVSVYVLLYLVQRQLFDHGLATSVPFVFPRTDVDPHQVQRILNGYLLLVGISCLLYTWVLLRVSRWRGRFMTALLLGVPAVLHVLALPTRPTLSMDAYSYLAHGYLAAHPPLNPYVQ